MAEWNNSIGRPCHYVCVDRAHHCLVLSIRWAAASTELHLASKWLFQPAVAVLEVDRNQVGSSCGSGRASNILQMAATECFSCAGCAQQGSGSVRASCCPTDACFSCAGWVAVSGFALQASGCHKASAQATCLAGRSVEDCSSHLMGQGSKPIWQMLGACR